ncbi:MAG: polysaccharide pyruvyl transferase family protein [Pseudomonadota bacterium]
MVISPPLAYCYLIVLPRTSSRWLFSDAAPASRKLSRPALWARAESGTRNRENLARCIEWANFHKRKTLLNSETRLLLMGFYGRRNFGDDIMALGLIEALTQRGVRDISVFCDSPRFLDGTSVSIVPRSISPLLRAVQRSDVLIQGGGTIFHDSYTGRALRRYWINLFVYGVIFSFARLSGTLVYLIGAGIGPIRHPVSRLLCRFALGRAKLIIVRDQPSFDEMQTLLPKTSAIAAHDLAFLNTPPAEVQRGDGRRRIGLSLCNLAPFMSGDAAQPWAAMAEALKELIPPEARPRYELRFLSLFTGHSSPSDAPLSRQVAQKLEGFDVSFVDYDEDPAHFWAETAACDMLIGTRFHNVVAGHIAQRPTLAVTYNRKVSDFCAKAGFTDLEMLSLEQAVSKQAWLARLPAFLDSSKYRGHLVPSDIFRQEMFAAIDQFVETNFAG